MSEEIYFSIVERWLRWSFHKQKYGHLYSVALRIPVPEEAQRIIAEAQVTNISPIDRLMAVARYMHQQGTLKPVAEPPNGPPSSTIGESYVHGLASGTATGGLTQGLKVGAKAAGRSLLQQLLAALFRR